MLIRMNAEDPAIWNDTETLKQWANEHKDNAAYFHFRGSPDPKPDQFIASYDGYCTMITANGNIYQDWAGSFSFVHVPDGVDPWEQGEQSC